MSNVIEIDLDGPGLDNEGFYDEILAPALLKIAQELETRGLGFLATVEYDAQAFGTTVNAPAHKIDTLRLAYLAARAHGNVDSIVIGWAKDCRESNRAHGSIFLQRAGVDPDPAKRNVDG